MLEESQAPPSPPPPQPQVRQAASARPRSNLYALKALLAINVVMYGLEMFLSGGTEPTPEVALALGANQALLVWSGEAWRLITSAFLHGSVWHLAFNMYGLFVLGSWLEEELGGARLLLLYLGSALTGSLASVLFGGGAPSLGASGAVFGFVGALLALTYLAPPHQRQVMAAVRRQLIFVVLLNLGIGLTVNNSAVALRVDNMAHMGGLLGGVVLGAGLVGSVMHGMRHRTTVGSLVVFSLLSGAMFAGALGPSTPAMKLVVAAVRAHAAGDTPRMRALLLEGARMAPHDPSFHANRFALCHQAHDDACALESLQVLLNLDPQSTQYKIDADALRTALTGAGVAAYQDGNRYAAVLATRRLAQLNPDDANVLNNHAWFLLMRGNLTSDEKEEALRAADRARRMARQGLMGSLVGGDLNVEHTWAEALCQAGRLEEALAVLQGMKDLNAVQRRLSGGKRFTLEMIDSEMERMRAGKPPRDFE